MDGDSIWLAGWLIQGSTPHKEEEAPVPPSMPFYRGNHQNGIPADDINSVITLHMPSAGSSG